MTVGDRIKLRRKELGINADQLAKALGVHRSTIFRYENGGIEKLPGDALIPIAEALHTTPAYLMGWEELVEEYNKDMADCEAFAKRFGCGAQIVGKKLNELIFVDKAITQAVCSDEMQLLLALLKINRDQRESAPLKMLALRNIVEQAHNLPSSNVSHIAGLIDAYISADEHTRKLVDFALDSFIDPWWGAWAEIAAKDGKE